MDDPARIAMKVDHSSPAYQALTPTMHAIYRDNKS